MDQGYLYLETRPEQPGTVRLHHSDTPPARHGAGYANGIRYVARFSNGLVAQMHVHNTLKRKLLDLNTRVYQVELAEAIAAIEAEDLKHTRVWIDPALDTAVLQQIDIFMLANQQHQQRTDRLFKIAGGIGIALLLFTFIVGMIR